MSRELPVPKNRLLRRVPSACPPAVSSVLPFGVAGAGGSEDGRVEAHPRLGIVRIDLVLEGIDLALQPLHPRLDVLLLDRRLEDDLLRRPVVDLSAIAVARVQGLKERARRLL